MQNNENQPVSTASIQIPCRHLRSKEMYYQAYGAAEDEFSSGVFWCSKTLENFGPDGEPCGKENCGGQRTCYIG